MVAPGRSTRASPRKWCAWCGRRHAHHHDSHKVTARGSYAIAACELSRATAVMLGQFDNGHDIFSHRHEWLEYSQPRARRWPDHAGVGRRRDNSDDIHAASARQGIHVCVGFAHVASLYERNCGDRPNCGQSPLGHKPFPGAWMRREDAATPPTSRLTPTRANMLFA